LKLEGTCNSTISGNLIQGNDGGLKLSHGYGDVSTTKNNIINENTIIMNNQYGIFLNGAPENQINNNIIANNSNGIILTSMFFEGYDILSNNNWITENQIIQNTNHGLQMNQCNDNLIHHNTFVDNLIQVHSEESINIWDNRLNTGNFWNDYSGIDVNHDGIGDTPYVIDENNQDNYPIVPVEIPANVEFDLIVSIAGLGSTSPSVGTYSFENGTEVIVNASPAPGWVFSNWILDSINVGNSNSYTVTMDENHSLSAVFTEIIPQQYALTLSTNGDGNTSPSVGTYTYEEASEVVVTASANSEWTFNHWELENVDVGNSNPYTIVMNTDHSLTAVFLKIPPAENVDEPFKVTTYNVIVEKNTYIIETWSNSTLSGLVLNLSANRISFNVEGISGTTGLCNITVPTELFSGQFLIYKNGTLLTKDLDYTESYNITHYLFSFTYEHSTHKIEIIATYAVPEFPFWIILPLFVAVSTTVIFYNKKLR
jgi:hypothetical protein